MALLPAGALIAPFLPGAPTRRVVLVRAFVLPSLIGRVHTRP